ncbi:hypothetical protein KSP39_PZI011570 [Platanthera zijinensis]|uniref:Uncharacterized protein n=1 Tax=Platanthera zijinensis TaxID=2320716 RepID=A0AAP0BH43_9ASPA
MIKSFPNSSHYQGGWVRDLASTSRSTENRCGHGWGAWAAARQWVPSRVPMGWAVKGLSERAGSGPTASSPLKWL